jgi:hypothetical protein
MPRLCTFVSLLVFAPALAMSACGDVPPQDARSLAASAPATSRADTLGDADLASDAMVPEDPAGNGTDEDLGSLDLERENTAAAAVEAYEHPCDEVIGPICIMHGRE